MSSNAGSSLSLNFQSIRQRNKERAWNFFTDYCNLSTIHGTKYLGERHRPWIEKCFWILTFCISIYGCLTIIYKIWNKWQMEPVIVSFDDKSTPIYEIPFPAVTICPEIKTRTEALNYTDYFFSTFEGNISIDKVSDTFEALYLVCREPNDLTRIPPEYGNVFLNTSFKENIGKIRPRFKDMFSRDSIWHNNVLSSEEHWQTTLTADGVCYSFNFLGVPTILRNETLHSEFFSGNYEVEPPHWDLEQGFLNPDKKGFPHRVYAASFFVGLQLDVRMKTADIDIMCRGLSPGFKMMLHMPNEMPQTISNFFRIPPGQQVLVAVRPNMRTTSKKLKSYSPEIRQCYFNSERYLQFFKNYTKNNCALECLANYTLRECGCVEFHMPRLIDTPVCGIASISCTERAMDMMIELEESGSICKCFPSCTIISYDAEVSLSEGQEKFLKSNKYQHSSFNIYFKEDQFWTSKRSELYGTIDFIANCGGILGLFMGVSVLSFVELIYFLVMRLPKFIRQEKQKDVKLSKIT